MAFMPFLIRKLLIVKLFVSLNLVEFSVDASIFKVKTVEQTGLSISSILLKDFLHHHLRP